MTCAQKYVRGLKVHSIMASTTQGVPWGILEQQRWTRPVQSSKKKKNQRGRKSISHKESKRWLTTLEVNNFEQAVRCIRWYTYRWLIERYHYVLKSGCRIEQLQLKNAERIKKALATYSILAWRYAERYPLGLLWLTYQARQNPNLPCDTVLEKSEWQSLYCHFQGFPLSQTPPTLSQAMIWIAQLGGFLARQHDGFPGVKTLWRGLQRLHDIASSWKLLHSSEKQDL
jgi:Transposase Tn5 dimerisation domain